ncbi:MAG: RdgB/HAM1 family non-canonical purine NTP pyrophosphatase [Ignavibacteria bacterium]
MNKLVVASKNKHKINEIKAYLKNMGIEILSLYDFHDISNITEDGSSFEENSFKKAQHVYNNTGITSLGDDSGLEVPYLSNEPGIFSARYAGEHASDRENNLKLLAKLADAKGDKRNARFRCVLQLVSSDNNQTFEGICSGRIIHEERGENGFGYDPLFIPDSFDKTFGELDLEAKLIISHRGKALAELKDFLKK